MKRRRDFRRYVFFSSRRRHTRWNCDWSSDVCSSDLALDIGLWDIAGKVAGLPLYQLWGAVTDRIPAYGSGGWARYSVEDLIGEAERYAGLGCRYYKMKIHHPDPRENRKRVEAVRRVLGDRVKL